MKVTDKNYFLHDNIKSLITFMSMRVSKNHDNLIIIDGKEGAGKTTLATAITYFYSWLMNIEFTEDNVFFDTNDLIEYAQTNEFKPILWDEAGLGARSNEWYNKSQLNLIKLLTTCRSKRHFFIFVIPDFKDLNPYFAGRATALFRVKKEALILRGKGNLLVDDDEVEPIRALWNLEKQHKKKYRSGSEIPFFYHDYQNPKYVDSPLIDWAKYDVKKARAVAALDRKSVDRHKKRLVLTTQMVLDLGIPMKEIAEKWGVSRQAVQQFLSLGKKAIGE